METHAVEAMAATSYAVRSENQWNYALLFSRAACWWRASWSLPGRRTMLPHLRKCPATAERSVRPMSQRPAGLRRLQCRATLVCGVDRLAISPAGSRLRSGSELLEALLPKRLQPRQCRRSQCSFKRRRIGQGPAL